MVNSQARPAADSASANFRSSSGLAAQSLATFANAALLRHSVAFSRGSIAASCIAPAAIDALAPDWSTIRVRGPSESRSFFPTSILILWGYRLRTLNRGNNANRRNPPYPLIR